MENLKTKFDFDDILIIPNTNTHIYSRYRGIILPKELPLFTAPMDTVVDLSNFEIFLENNINVCLPRTIKYDDYIKHVSVKNINRRFNFLTQEDINSYNNNIFISVGFKDLDLYYKNNFKVFHENAHILIDVANGHMQKIIDYCKEIKRLRPDIIIMAGNIANPETYRWYAQNNCVDYIRVGIGNGCFGRGTRILMGNGVYKNIEDICAGDEIVNMYGSVVKVKRLIFNGIKHVVNLKTSMSPKDIIVTSKHNYYVGCYKKKDIRSYGYSNAIKNYEWSEIGSYNENQTPLFPKSIRFNMNNSFSYDLIDFAIQKKCTKKYKTKIKSNYNIGYIFGTFLGDGNSRIQVQKRINKNNSDYKKSTIGSVHWSFGINEIDILNKLKQCLLVEFNLIPKVKFTKNMIKVSLYCKPLAHLLFEFNKRTNKHLPEKYLVNNKQYLIGMFNGLVDSDGHNDNGRISFHNTSIKLIELYNIIQYLLHNTLPNSVTRKTNNSKLIKNSNVSFSSRNLLSPEKRNTVDNKFIINKIVNIIDNNENVEVFDLEIDDESHSFIANNCIVHNSGCLTTKQSGVGYPMASLIHETYHIKQELIKNNPNIKLPFIVADGGMKNYSDIIKVLALGADYVMLGSIFNKALESCADNYLFGIKLNNSLAKYFFDNGFPIKKYYRGMSTKGAQKAMGKTDFKTSEGITRFRRVEYTLYGWIDNLKHYLRTAMSYSDAKTLNDFIGKVEIIQITKNAYDRYNK
jgi:hypothetical protein